MNELLENKKLVYIAEINDGVMVMDYKDLEPHKENINFNDLEWKLPVNFKLLKTKDKKRLAINSDLIFSIVAPNDRNSHRTEINLSLKDNKITFVGIPETELGFIEIIRSLAQT